MLTKSPGTLLFLLLLICFGYANSSDSPTEDDVSEGETELTGQLVGQLVGNSKAGEEKYVKGCINCHGAGGKGVASYPKVSGNEISYTKSKLETYREGIKIGPNSSLMIMMARPLTDEEITNLALYLKDAK